MKFWESLDTSLGKKYSSFKGRSGRSEFYYFLIFMFVVSFVWGMLGSFIFPQDTAGLEKEIERITLQIANNQISEEEGLQMIFALTEEGMASASFISKLFSIIPTVLFLLPGCAVGVRRMQDLDIAYYAAIPYILNSFAWVILAVLSTFSYISLNSYISYLWILALIFIVYWLFYLRKGTGGPNRFGEDPNEITNN